MRKQTKLVAVLSTAALLAIGASMTSFAAQGWAEEDGTWVYYDRNGDRVTDKWAKSGNNWYYLDSDGEMAIDTLIEDGDNHYYVDVNGVMASNQWVAIENEDAGSDNEPDQWWYYFQANGKALKGPDDGKIALKTVNGKKYAFNDEGQMLYGWIKEDDQSIYNDDADAWKEAVYYFGDQNDGAMTTSWMMVDINDDQADDTSQHWIAPTFTDDEDQSRYFYFKSNGKKVQAANADEVKERTINGKKYGFDVYGRMVAEWSYDRTEAASGSAAATPTPDDKDATSTSANARRVNQSLNWKYFQSVEDGRKLTKDWFQVVPAEYLDEGKYDDDEAKWYYVDGSGNLYANEIKTIKGKKYAFDKFGRCLDGLHFIQTSGSYSTSNFGEIKNDDDGTYNFDDEDSFDTNSILLKELGYSCYYFGDDGAMRTGTVNVNIDGDNYSFNFGKSGSTKGVGKTGEDNKKYYNSSKLMSAGKDEKFQVIMPVADTNSSIIGYTKFTDAADFASRYRANTTVNGQIEVLNLSDLNVFASTDSKGNTTYSSAAKDVTVIGNEKINFKLNDLGLSTSKLKDDKIGELHIYVFKAAGDTEWKLGLPTIKNGGFAVVNTSGRISENNSKNKDGNDVYYKLKGDKIVATYTED